MATDQIDHTLDPNDPLAPKPKAAPMDPTQAAQAGLGWVPPDHPLYGTAGYVGAPAPDTGAGGGATGGGVPGNALTQATTAQSYSATPWAAPTNATTNQGTQDTVRNTYLSQIQKGTAVDRNDPNFRQQADTYAAAQERTRRNALDDSSQASFANGTRGSGGDLVERRMIDEASARNVGQFEASLVGQELTARRDEIKNALASLGGMISDDQKFALNRELAALDAAIKREQIALQGQLGNADINLRDKLGTGALNVDLLRALLQNSQFGIDAGIRIGDLEGKYAPF